MSTLLKSSVRSASLFVWAAAHTASSKWVTFEALFQWGQLPMSDSFHHHVSNTNVLMNNLFWMMGGQKHCFKCVLEPRPLSSSLIISSPRFTRVLSSSPLLSSDFLASNTSTNCSHMCPLIPHDKPENKTSSLSKQTLSILMKIMARQNRFCNPKGFYDHCLYK